MDSTRNTYLSSIGPLIHPQPPPSRSVSFIVNFSGPPFLFPRRSSVHQPHSFLPFTPDSVYSDLFSRPQGSISQNVRLLAPEIGLRSLLCNFPELPTLYQSRWEIFLANRSRRLLPNRFPDLSFVPQISPPTLLLCPRSTLTESHSSTVNHTFLPRPLLDIILSS